jgi:flagellar basal-body rod protein FlgG
MEAGLKMLSDAMTIRIHQTDVIANNIANSNTVGFKQLDVTTKTDFSDEINALIKDDVARKETALNSTIPKLSRSHIDQIAGAIKMTNNKYDFTLKDPNMMFMIKSDDGNIAYTRDGSFKTLNGFLVTGDNKPVLSSDGGIIELEDDNKIPSLGVAKINFKTLIPHGDNLYLNNNSNNPYPLVEDSSEYILQGALESSNVNIVKSMTNLITAHRSYEQMSKLMQGIDELNKQAATEVGNVRG